MNIDFIFFSSNAIMFLTPPKKCRNFESEITISKQFIFSCLVITASKSILKLILKLLLSELSIRKVNIYVSFSIGHKIFNVINNLF